MNQNEKKNQISLLKVRETMACISLTIHSLWVCSLILPVLILNCPTTQIPQNRTLIFNTEFIYYIILTLCKT